MSLCKARLPDEYVLAFPDDPAIDWDATAEKWGIPTEEDHFAVLQAAADEAAKNAGEEPEPLPKMSAEEARVSVTRLRYAESGAKATLGLVAREGQAITKFVFKPFTQKESIQVDRKLEELRGENGKLTPADIKEFSLFVFEMALVKVDDYSDTEGREYESVDDLTVSGAVTALGSRVYSLNTLSPLTRDF